MPEKLDKSIPFKNIIMRCDLILPELFTDLPEGYSFRLFEKGEEYSWADIAVAVGDCDTIDQAVDYFSYNYLSEIDLFKARCLFVTAPDHKTIGTCTAWYDLQDGQRIASLHWLLVDPMHQGKGIGRALLSETMKLFLNNGEYPVYLHTQPWSFKAVNLYLSMGFHMLKTESFASYENQYPEAVEVLKPLLKADTYQKLIITAR